MGNYKFRLSEMIPNAWFYKLKDMSRLKNKPTKKKSHTTSSQSSLSLSSVAVAAAATLPNQPHSSDQRKSYYFTRDLNKTKDPDKTPPTQPPRKSSRKRRSTKKSRQPPRLVNSSSISAGCSCRATLESVWTNKPPAVDTCTSSSDHDSMLTEYGSDRADTFAGRLSWSTSSCKCRGQKNQIAIKMDGGGTDDDDKDGGEEDRHDDDDDQFDHLPPIITKKIDPTKIQRTSAEFTERNAYGSLSVKVVKEDLVTDWTNIKNQHKTTNNPVARRLSSSSPGVKLRTNSPRIGNRRRKSAVSPNSRRSVSETFAVVKTSRDPRRDFRESMVEMIVENNIRASKDLEELLACYLSLNSDEYHDVIINVFKQIWFDYLHVPLVLE